MARDDEQEHVARRVIRQRRGDRVQPLGLSADFFTDLGGHSLIAARFVSGYLYSPARDGAGHVGGGSTHAWVRVYLPGTGWVEFDPTNGIVGNRDLIRVAVAREQARGAAGVDRQHAEGGVGGVHHLLHRGGERHVPDAERPDEARERFAAIPQADVIGVDGAKHLWVGEKYVRRVLDEIVRIVADGDIVVVYAKSVYDGKAQAVADIFRVANGKIVEHWEVIQDDPGRTVSGHPFIS